MGVPLPSSFERQSIDAGGVRINCAVGGSGPEHTVVITDLREMRRQRQVRTGAQLRRACLVST